jgi:hypothetical protein
MPREAWRTPAFVTTVRTRGQGGIAAFNAAGGFNWTASVTNRRAERGTRKATPHPHGAPIIDERPHWRRRSKRRPDSFLRGTGPPP